jgi:hypothetical protein
MRTAGGGGHVDAGCRGTADHPIVVTKRTIAGSQRIVDMLVGQLPRTCPSRDGAPAATFGC